jgi:hypothetical protein
MSETFQVSRQATCENKKRITDRVYHENIFPKEISRIIAEYAVIPSSFYLDPCGQSFLGAYVFANKERGCLLFTADDRYLYIYSEDDDWNVSRFLNVGRTSVVAIWNDNIMLTIADNRLSCFCVSDPKKKWVSINFCIQDDHPLPNSCLTDVHVVENHCFIKNSNDCMVYRWYSLELKNGHLILQLLKFISEKDIPSHPVNDKIFVGHKPGLYAYSNHLVYFQHTQNTFFAIDAMARNVLKKMTLDPSMDNIYVHKIYAVHNYLFIDTFYTILVVHLGAFIETT